MAPRHTVHPEHTRSLPSMAPRHTVHPEHTRSLPSGEYAQDNMLLHFANKVRPVPSVFSNKSHLCDVRQRDIRPLRMNIKASKIAGFLRLWLKARMTYNLSLQTYHLKLINNAATMVFFCTCYTF